jgi:UDP-N-acetyl-2-amino-2-deoxyglucuronate dehydrogenase
MTNVGVIGVGACGEFHLKRYLEIPGCNVVSICDDDPARLLEMSQRHGISDTYDQYSDLLKNPDIDAVSICTFDDGHAEQTVAALRAGKHVMVEKPLAISREQANLVKKAQMETGLIVTSNLVLRKSPRFAEIKRRISRGEMGELYLLEGDYIHSIEPQLTKRRRYTEIEFYSPIFGGAIHLLDLVRWLADEEVVEVCAMGTNKIMANTSYPFDDTNLLLMRFQNGAIAKIGVTVVPKHPKYHSLRVFGSKATFVNSLGDGKWHTNDAENEPSMVQEAYPGVDKGDLLPKFLKAVRSEGEPEVSTEDVFKVMDICLAAYESSQTRKFVSL